MNGVFRIERTWVASICSANTQMKVGHKFLKQAVGAQWRRLHNQTRRCDIFDPLKGRTQSQTIIFLLLYLYACVDWAYFAARHLFYFMYINYLRYGSLFLLYSSIYCVSPLRFYSVFFPPVCLVFLSPPLTSSFSVFFPKIFVLSPARNDLIFSKPLLSSPFSLSFPRFNLYVHMLEKTVCWSRAEYVFMLTYV